MTRITKLRRGAIDHEDMFVGATLNATGQILVTPAGTTWELDILTNINALTQAPAGQQAYVTSLSQLQSSGLQRTIIQLSGTPSTDTSGDRRLFLFINGAELPASSLIPLTSGDPTDQITFDLNYSLDPASDTIKVWYSV